MSADVGTTDLSTRHKPELPRPIIQDWDWQLKASCRGGDIAVFFVPGDIQGRERTMLEDRAKAVCDQCPVAAECLLYALRTYERHGIWGGTTPSERAKRLRGKRRF